LVSGANTLLLCIAVTNFQSKRKTPTCISFYKGERLFGSDSFALMPRKPEVSFSKLFRMLGKAPEHPHLQELERHYFPFELYANETWGATSLKLEEAYYHPEELLAMMMQHARDMTKSYGGKMIKDCVLTVPSSFTQHERAALYTAAAIADFNVLSLIEENTAAALNFGMDRNFDSPTTVLFYNMGASTTQVTVVNFTSYAAKESGSKNKTVSQFEVVAKAWDSSLGGFSFDMALTELLADRFNAAWAAKLAKSNKPSEGNDIRKFSRPMTRLRLEALKIKEVLSANNEIPLKIEQLHAEVDLVTKVTRAELEQACQPLFARAVDVIQSALSMGNLTLADITAVELLGGSVRVPKVKKTLEEYFRAGDLELGQHLNGDEAMALGAAFRAANLSTAFRVRKVGMQDISSFGIAVHLSDAPEAPASKGFFDSVASMFTSSESKDGVAAPVAVDGSVAAAAGAAWTKRAALFPRLSAVPSKIKTVTFSHDKDIVCRLEYELEGESARLLPAGTHPLVAVYNISGISKFVAENADKVSAAAPKVHLSFQLDSSGMVTLSKAEITLELPVEPEPEPEAEPAAAEEKEGAEAETAAAAASSADAAGSEDSSSGGASSSSQDEQKDEGGAAKSKDKGPEKKKGTKKEKERTLRRALQVDYDFAAPSPPQWPEAQVQEARRRLAALDAIDRQRKEREAALNALEGYMYLVKNKISDNAEELAAVSTAEERQAVLDLCDQTEEWLYGDGREQPVAAYTGKEKDVKSLAEPIFRRHTELTERPSAVAKTKKQLEGIRKRAAAWNDTMPQITANETEKMLELVDKVDNWLTEREAEQATKSPFEEPAFFSTDIAPQMKPVANMLDRLLKKPKPAPVKVRG
jgi:hypoxia up-regulated 1